MNALQAVVEAISESDNEIGGLLLTRMSTIAEAGDTEITVETTANFADAGAIGIDGVAYSYTGKTPTTFEGLSYQRNGISISGLAQQHAALSPVADLGGVFSAIDRLRRGFLSEYAEGEDLNVIGRNLGVIRSPFLGDDDQYRRVIQAIAYNPRGTEYGIELALAAILGSGNFEVIQDIDRPGVVQISIADSVSTSDRSEGKAFLANAVVIERTGGGTSYTLPFTGEHVYKAVLAPVEINYDARNEAPLDAEWSPFDGATPVDVFSRVGGSNGSVTASPGEHQTLSTTSGQTREAYTHGARMVPESRVVVRLTVSLSTSAVVLGSGIASGKAGGVQIDDGTNLIECYPYTSSGDVAIDFGNQTFTTSQSASTDYIELRIEKEGGSASLYLDGEFVGQIAASNMAAGSAPAIDVGVFEASATQHLAELAFSIETPTDYSTVRTTSATSTGPNEIESTSIDFTGSLGESVRVTGTSTNTNGGNSDGTWRISSVTNADEITAAGFAMQGARVDASNSDRVIAPTEIFTYPDDLGKRVRIGGSAQSNDGIYTITSLLHPVTEAALTAPETTNLAVLQAATFTTENNLEIELLPNFSTETVTVEKPGEATISGTTATLPVAVPAVPNAAAQIFYGTNHSAMPLEQSSTRVVLENASPRVYSFYGFYVHDPLGIVRSYIDSLTAAGVIPSFLI